MYLKGTGLRRKLAFFMPLKVDCVIPVMRDSLVLPADDLYNCRSVSVCGTAILAALISGGI